jgi:uncharacterized protein (DUF433 family)
MGAIAELSSLIEIDPNYMGGWPMVAGTGVPVIRVAYCRIDEGMTPEEIAEDWQLSLSQVYAALAYYYLNRDELDRQVDEADAESERMAREWPQLFPR